MAQPDRETVYAALQTLLVAALGPSPGSATFQTIQRRLLTITNAVPASAPYLLQVQATERSETKKGVPTVHTFTVNLLAYAYFGDGDAVVPDIVLNGLVTAIENACGPNMATAFQQLGIPVSSVVINGIISYFDMAATSGTWSLARVPVEIVATY